MSKRLRDAIERDVNCVNLQHRFVVKLCSADSHRDHYTGHVRLLNCVMPSL